MAASLGIARPTLRNYTGLFRLDARGGISRSVVASLMDLQVIPSSNPYARLRLGLPPKRNDHDPDHTRIEHLLPLPTCRGSRYVRATAEAIQPTCYGALNAGQPGRGQGSA